MEEALEAERAAGRAEGSRRRTSDAELERLPVTGGAESPAAGRDGPLTGPRPATTTPKPAGSGSSPSVPGVTAPMIADVVIITIDEITQQHRLPIPSRLLVAFAVFGVLGLAKGQAARPAKVFAWGIVVATFYSSAPGGKPSALNALAVLGDFLGGKYGSTGAAAVPSGGNIAGGANGVGGGEASRPVGNGQKVA